MWYHEYQRTHAHDNGTDTDPDGDMPPAAQVAHEYNGYHVANLVGGCDRAGQTRRYIKPLLDCCYHRINVTRA